MQVALGVWMMSLGLVSAQRLNGSAPEYDVKAAYVYNFVALTQWPDTAFPTASAPIRVCVVGENPFGNALERTVQGQTAAGRRIVVSRQDQTDRLVRCHVAFIPSAVDPRPALQALDMSPVLTVGESQAFAQAGGMIVLVPDAGRIRFEVNRTAAHSHGLTFSAHLLEVARSVR